MLLFKTMKKGGYFYLQLIFFLIMIFCAYMWQIKMITKPYVLLFWVCILCSTLSEWVRIILKNYN